MPTNHDPAEGVVLADIDHHAATETRLGFFERDSLPGEFFDRRGRFVKVRATHAFEYRPMLGELNIRVLDYLHAVAPRIPELHSSSG